MTPNKKGCYKTRLNRLKLKLLGAVQTPLEALLEQDEQVLHVAAATAYYPAELFFGNGWLTTLYNRYKAALRSLLLPGLGDIYLGHRFLGGLELLGSLFVWGIVAILLLSNDIGMAIVLLLIYNGFDSLLTLHMAKKGHSVEKKQPQTAAMGQLSTSRA